MSKHPCTGNNIVPHPALSSSISLMEELLPCLGENDILKLNGTLKTLYMEKRILKAKQLHPYKIYHTEKSGYFTSVDDDRSSYGKRKIRRCSEDSLWNALADWYLDKDNKTTLNNKITLKEVYTEWLAWKTTPRNDENIRRIQASWKAYYLNEPLSNKILNTAMYKITSLMLREWAESLLKKHYPVDKKKLSRIFSIINQCYEYASDEDRLIVPENLWQKARKKLNRDLIVAAPLPSDEEQVFTDDERKQLKLLIHDDLKKFKKQASSAGLQILFLFETGLRIGECCGLKWTDIKDGRLYIRRQATNRGVKEWTKSAAGCRDIPLTTGAKQVLEEIKAFNTAHGYTAEWIFQSDNPQYDYRLSYNAADRKLRKLCERLHTVVKSPHKCRKTCISALLDSPEINNRTVQRFAGHQELTTTFNFYSFERKSKNEQALAIDRALAL